MKRSYFKMLFIMIVNMCFFSSYGLFKHINRVLTKSGIELELKSVHTDFILQHFQAHHHVITKESQPATSQAAEAVCFDDVNLSKFQSDVLKIKQIDHEIEELNKKIEVLKKQKEAKDEEIKKIKKSGKECYSSDDSSSSDNERASDLQIEAKKMKTDIETFTENLQEKTEQLTELTSKYETNKQKLLTNHVTEDSLESFLTWAISSKKTTKTTEQGRSIHSRETVSAIDLVNAQHTMEEILLSSTTASQKNIKGGLIAITLTTSIKFPVFVQTGSLISFRELNQIVILVKPGRELIIISAYPI